MKHPQQDDPVQPGELEDKIQLLAAHHQRVVLTPKFECELVELITGEAVRLCNAVIGEDELCDGNHGKWVAGCPICERNDTRADQRQRLADLVKGEADDE